MPLQSIRRLSSSAVGPPPALMTDDRAGQPDPGLMTTLPQLGAPIKCLTALSEMHLH
jgi:hypothetical protein